MVIKEMIVGSPDDQSLLSHLTHSISFYIKMTHINPLPELFFVAKTKQGGCTLGNKAMILEGTYWRKDNLYTKPN